MLMPLVSLAGLVLVALSLGTITPRSMVAQEQRVDTLAIDEARLSAYAKAFTAIGLARDQAHAEMALPKNKTIEEQKELRDALHTRIEKILRDNSLTKEQYTQLTYVISTDPERRKAFEEIVARLTPKPQDR
jgi:hypothetical protein